MNAPFFMVYVEGERNPAFTHSSLESAENEAKRLAELTNKTSFVLCSLKSFKLNKFIVDDCRPSDDLPF